MYIPTIVLLVIVLLVIESVFVKKKHKIRHFRPKKMKLDIFVSYLSQCYQSNNEKKTNAAVWT